MKLSRNVWIAGIAAALVIAVGCGGAGTIGAGTTGGSGGSDSNSLQGTILAPANQVTGALSSRGDALVPLASASVEVVNLETGEPVGSGTTDENGDFTVKDVPTDVDLEVIAKKKFGNGELRLGGIVQQSDGSSDEKVFDPDTTVAAEAAKDQLETLKNSDPTAKAKLADLAKEIAGDRKQRDLPSPDLTNPDKVKEDADKWLKDRPAVGHYFGKFDGSSSGYLVAFVKNGHFMMAAFDAEGSGSDDHEVDHVAFGKIGERGVMTGRADNVHIVGLMVGGVGTGNWKDDKGNTGTWTIRAVTSEVAGIYAGGFVNENGEERNGYFAAVVLDDNSVWMTGKVFEQGSSQGAGGGAGKGREDSGGSTGNQGDDHKTLILGMVGWGKLNSDGSIAFIYSLNDKTTGSGTAEKVENVIKGSITNKEGKTFYFKTDRNFDPFEEKDHHDE